MNISFVVFALVCVCACDCVFMFVQGQELTVRQMALLGFRDLVLLKLHLETLLPKAPLPYPPAITQMLLILQVSETSTMVPTSTHSDIFPL